MPEPPSHPQSRHEPGTRAAQDSHDPSRPESGPSSEPAGVPAGEEADDDRAAELDRERFLDRVEAQVREFEQRLQPQPYKEERA